MRTIGPTGQGALSMTIKLEVFTTKKDMPADAKEQDHFWDLTEKEEVRFYLFASKLKRRCEELGLAKYITFVRVAPTGNSGSGGIIRNSHSIAAHVNIGISVKVGKKKSVQDFTVDYWRNSVVAAPLDDRFTHGIRYVTERLVEFALERFRQTTEPVEPVVELKTLLETLTKKK